MQHKTYKKIMNNKLIIKLSQFVSVDNHIYNIFLDTIAEIAQVSFTKKNNVFEVALEVAAPYRNKGFGTSALKLATDEFINNHAGDIVAYIDSSNIISQKTFLKAGYYKIEEIEIKSKRYVKFQYNK